MLQEKVKTELQNSNISLISKQVRIPFSTQIGRRLREEKSGTNPAEAGAGPEDLQVKRRNCCKFLRYILIEPQNCGTLQPA